MEASIFLGIIGLCPVATLTAISEFWLMFCRPQKLKLNSKTFHHMDCGCVARWATDNF